MRRPLAAGLALVLLLAACSDDGDPESSPTTTAGSVATGGTTSTTAPLPEGTLDQVELAVEEVGVLDEPIALAARPGSPDLYIAEKAGRVRLVKGTEVDGSDSIRYQVQTTPLLDLSDDVKVDEEQGLLGMAFSSDGRKLYLDYTAEPDGATTVVEYELGDRSSIDDDSRRVVLEVEQPFANHNGGHLAVGPDGYLYVALGDGGSSGDPQGNGQDVSTLLGSILRIDPEAAAPDGDDEGQGEGDGPAYGIPPGNPFVDEPEAAPEIWLYGVRNPWRFSFDADTGDLWVGDVGQDQWEEIDLLPATGGFEAGRGANLGWDEMEGTHPFEGGENPPGAVLPIHEYGHDAGCSVIGGYVYRGDVIPGLDGTYLYADHCAAGIRGLQVASGQVIDERTWDLPVTEVQSLGEGDDGEIFLLLTDGRVLKLSVPGTDEDDDASG